MFFFIQEMKFTSIIIRNGRRTQNENKVPFKSILPLKLKDHVTSGNQRLTEKGCLQEMTLLLNCLEKNEFEDMRCVSEVNVLNNCYKTYTENMERSKILKEQSVPVPNSKDLTSKQVTYLLRQYPVV
ncbi:small ribosomal subunit protein mS37 isoform X2 [Cardiocondyla obscurior]|uniref:small ribosomal subunit protein mS37 isoform X2 n=1 Tax=Cardiocondyla obscurior TaxID=286306 RepID=UPI00396572DE